ncbi:MAG: hypothetical protein V4577_21595 [Bacteroidota bacterium]
MSKFVLEEINDVNGEVEFFKILEDGTCYWNDFCIEIETKTNWGEELDQLKARMDDVSNRLILPKEKFRKYKGFDDTYEVKTRNLRAYLLLDENGYVLINASKKSDQEKGINKYKAIITRYLQEKQNVKSKDLK